MDNLDAFTEYSINVSAHNYYTVSDPTPGPEAIYMTGIGGKISTNLVVFDFVSLVNLGVF